MQLRVNTRTMPKFNANLSLMFAEVDLAGRFDRAAQAGFRAVEVQFPYELPAAQLADLLGQCGLEMILHNLPAGDWAGGDRGIAAQPERRGEFQDGVSRAIDYAKAMTCTRLNALAGLTAEGAPPEQCFDTLVENLRFAATALAGEGIALMTEPVNTRDVPGFFLSTTRQALRVMAAVNHPNLWLQYDIFHMQVMEGELINTIRALAGPGAMPRIGHMQLADNPGRHEPGTGEINYPNVFRAIDESGYTGWIGCEYIPQGITEDVWTGSRASSRRAVINAINPHYGFWGLGFGDPIRNHMNDQWLEVVGQVYPLKSFAPLF